MAFRINTSYKNIAIYQSYATVELPQISLDKSSVEFGVWYRVDRGGECFHAVTHVAPYTLDGGDPFEQAYLHLKSLKEFEGAEDC